MYQRLWRLRINIVAWKSIRQAMLRLAVIAAAAAIKATENLPFEAALPLEYAAFTMSPTSQFMSQLSSQLYVATCTSVVWLSWIAEQLAR